MHGDLTRFGLFSTHKQNVKLRNVNERLATVKLFKKTGTLLFKTVSCTLVWQGRRKGLYVMEGQRSAAG